MSFGQSTFDTVMTLTLASSVLTPRFHLFTVNPFYGLECAVLVYPSPDSSLHRTRIDAGSHGCPCFVPHPHRVHHLAASPCEPLSFQCHLASRAQNDGTMQSRRQNQTTSNRSKFYLDSLESRQLQGKSQKFQIDCPDLRNIGIT